MKILKFFLYSLVSLSFCACSSKPSEEESGSDKQTHADHHGHGVPGAEELMAIHDSIMPRMGELMELSEAVRARIDRLDSLKRDNHTSEIAAARGLVKELDLAGESMMSWMHQYKADTLDKIGATEAKEYLSKQKKSILDVKNSMETSISNARDFLKRTP